MKTANSKSALPGVSRFNAFAAEPEILVVIGLDTDDGPSHPLYDERIHLPLEENMVLNVMEFGILEPVIVRKNGDKPEVLDGRQRTRWAREANKRLVKAGLEPLKVPVVVKRGSDGYAAGVMIATNECRRDDDAMTKAKKAQRFLNMGNTEEDTAIRFGVSVPTLRRYTALLDLAPRAQKALASGALGQTAASELAKLPREEQEAKLAETIAQPVREVRERVRTARSVVGPSKGRVRKLAKWAAKNQWLDKSARLALEWVIGDATDEDMGRIHGFKEFLNAETNKRGRGRGRGKKAEAQ